MEINKMRDTDKENIEPKSTPKSTSTRHPSGKRTDYLHWQDYFMSIALLSAKRSKDPSTQVGACIVNDENKIVAIGYNGMPTGCNDNDLPWNKTAENPLDTKYPYVCHAEMNAIMNKNSADVKNCTMFVTLFPCNECAKLIIQAGVRKVVFLKDVNVKYQTSFEATKRMFNLAGVCYEK